MTITRQFILFLYYGIRVLVALAFVSFLFLGDWTDAFNTALILILMVVPSFLKNKYSVYFPLELDLAIVTFIFFTLFLGSLRDFYELFPLWDGVLHFQSGILLGIVGFVLIYVLNEQKTKRLELTPGFISFFAITFSLAISVVWEIYEYIVDTFFGFNMQETGLPDTMGDLIVNAVGALIVGLVGYVWMRYRQKLPFTPRLLSGFRYRKGEKPKEGEDIDIVQ
ncbi:hypothetical protein ACFL6I_16020 [candidate division KSB1 bacterium]